eukprot:g73134.t1
MQACLYTKHLEQGQNVLCFRTSSFLTKRRRKKAENKWTEAGHVSVGMWNAFKKSEPWIGKCDGCNVDFSVTKPERWFPIFCPNCGDLRIKFYAPDSPLLRKD